jgi:hypothetical protein
LVFVFHQPHELRNHLLLPRPLSGYLSQASLCQQALQIK